ncbi:MAG: peptide-methionine (S)-S-oxide reductase MsrA [Bacteroidota bacterium]
MKHLIFLSLVALLFVLPSCSHGQKINSTAKAYEHGVLLVKEYIKDKDLKGLDVATFAGGCFWCTEASFERIKGVEDVIRGYSGGEKKYPTYSEVSNKKTKHAEAIQIFYNPEIVSFETLLEVFFVAHDPTQLNRQGPDIGPQYRSEIFYHDESQKEKTLTYIEKLDKAEKFSKKIVTKVSAYSEFWVAEGYHQNYYELNPNQGYIAAVSRPKVEKVIKTFPDLIKEAYKM